jgi:transaldolase
MIKVPGTAAGLVAVEELIAAGINVNVTLLFSLRRYRDVAHAFLTGLERAAGSGRALESIASVASFFLSRIDTMVDGNLERIIAEGGKSAASARELLGEIAIASAKRAYAIHQEVATSRRCEALLRSGARMQRLLWASTGTKNPEYDEIKYVQSLIGPQTVSTMPLETLEAYERDGVPRASLTEGLTAAQEPLDKLEILGIPLDHLTDQLLAEGIDKFVRPFDATFREIDQKRRLVAAAGPPP